MQTSDIEKRCRNLIFAVEKSQRYHRRHGQFIATATRFITFLSALAGTGVVAALLKDAKATATVLGFVVAAAGTLQLVFDLEGKVRENFKALDAFARLRRVINECPTFDEAKVIAWENQRVEIEAGFVAELDALNVDCHNETLDAMGSSSPRYQIAWWQRTLLHVASIQRDFPPLAEASRPDRETA